jgi:hypothetical protein
MADAGHYSWDNAAGRGRVLVTVLAVCSFLASGCGGAVAGNGQTDGASGSGEGNSSGDAATNVDATACSIVLASNYDQSCTVDADCVAVGEVPVCPAGCGCATKAINKSAIAPYMTALSRAFASEPAGGGCGCPCESGAVCRGGQCRAAFCAPPLVDTLPVCADAGGRCSYAANTTCTGMGPPDACAYSDEICCI